MRTLTPADPDSCLPASLPACSMPWKNTIYFVYSFGPEAIADKIKVVSSII